MLGLVARDDRLKRFTATSHTCDLAVMGRSVRLETNSLSVLRHTRRAVASGGSAFSPGPQFILRIAGEEGGSVTAERREPRLLAADGLWLERLGPRCFFAIDTENRIAVAYAPGHLVVDEAAFARAFLGPLLERIAAALGLTCVPAACLLMAGRGVLLFGSESDRLAVCRLLAKLGLEVWSDPTTFLEFDSRALLAWRRTWSVSMGQEEPSQASRRDPSAHRSEFDPEEVRRPVSPTLSVFLEGESSELPRLTPLGSRTVGQRLEEMHFSSEGVCGNASGESVRSALGRLPAYRLAYGRDGATAAVFIHSLLKTNASLEARR